MRRIKDWLDSIDISAAIFVTFLIAFIIVVGLFIRAAIEEDAARPPDNTPMKSLTRYGPDRFIDEEAGVVCYQSASRDGLVCFLIKDTRIQR